MSTSRSYSAAFFLWGCLRSLAQNVWRRLMGGMPERPSGELAIAVSPDKKQVDTNYFADVREVVPLLDESWLCVLSFFGPKDLCRCARLDQKFRSLSNDDGLWRHLCRIRWKNKQWMPDDLFRNGDYSRHQLSVAECKSLLKRRGISFVLAREKPELVLAVRSSTPQVLSNGQSLPIPGKWKCSYAYAELDSTRVNITEDEVGYFRWQLIYHGQPSNMGLRHFQRNGTFVSPHFGATTWSLHSNGRYFVMQGVQPLEVERNPETWGWIIGAGSGTEYRSVEVDEG